MYCSDNVAEIIPFKDFKEKVKVVRQEVEKGRYVEVWSGYVYSAEKWVW